MKKVFSFVAFVMLSLVVVDAADARCGRGIFRGRRSGGCSVGNCAPQAVRAPMAARCVGGVCR